MNPNYYEYHISKNFLEYLFCSEGPKGNIKKLVRFTQVNEDGTTYYNLGFGNWNESADTIDDVSISNNSDTERILFTIAAIILDFTDHYPDAIIYIKGSTAARTRLYQIKINRYWQIIKDMFELYGYLENEDSHRSDLIRIIRLLLPKRKMTKFMILRFEMPLKKDNKVITPRGIIDPNMRDHKDHPFFVKKAEASKKVIEKYGLPKEWIKEKK